MSADTQKQPPAGGGQPNEPQRDTAETRQDAAQPSQPTQPVQTQEHVSEQHTVPLAPPAPYQPYQGHPGHPNPGPQNPSQQYQGQQYARPQYGQYAHPQQPQAHHTQPPAVHPHQASPSDPYGIVFGAPADPGKPRKPGRDGENRRPGWVPVASAAVIAALLASGGTAAIVSALDDDGAAPSSLADVGTGTTENDSAPVANSSTESPDWRAVTAAVAPSVVAIQVQSQQGGAEGSGVILDAEGHVLTNNHVVSGGENGNLAVTLSDGRIFEATIVGTDPTTDLAVIKLTDAPDDLKPATLGDSSKVQVGEPVLAVGNPLGLANTATTGIVSALDRPVSASGEDGSSTVVTNAIQIDAAVNPGNSGGPLFDSSGRVIGITSSIATLSNGGQSGSIGLGFAIPVNLARNIAEQLKEDGTAEHAFLGVRLSDATATADGVTRRGAEVVEVTSGSPAAEAGIQAGDVIVAVDQTPVGGAEALTGDVRERAAGDRVAVTFVRDGATQTVNVTLAASDSQAQQTPEQQGSEEGDQGEQGQGSDPTQPDNIPGWLEDLFGGGR